MSREQDEIKNSKVTADEDGYHQLILSKEISSLERQKTELVVDIKANPRMVSVRPRPISIKQIPLPATRWGQVVADSPSAKIDFCLDEFQEAIVRCDNEIAQIRYQKQRELVVAQQRLHSVFLQI